MEREHTYMNKVRKGDWAPGHQTGQLKEGPRIPEFFQNSLFVEKQQATWGVGR